MEIHCEGRQLPYSIFDNNQCVSQGAVVENKRLGAVFDYLKRFEAEQKAKRKRQNRRAAFRREVAALRLDGTQ